MQQDFPSIDWIPCGNNRKILKGYLLKQGSATGQNFLDGFTQILKADGAGPGVGQISKFSVLLPESAGCS